MAAPRVRQRTGPAPWIQTLYYVVAAYWIVEGLFIVIMGLLLLLPSADNSATAGMVQGIGAAILAIGAFIALLGIGLLLKWEWCRGVVNVFSWLRILGGLWRLKDFVFGAFFMSSASLVLGLFFTVVGIVAAGTQVWLLSETD